MIKPHLSLETLANVPLVSSISNSALNRTRQKRTPVLPICCSFDIPDLYQFTSAGEKVVSDFELGLILAVAAELSIKVVIFITISVLIDVLKV
ncbi:unnamed protein product [Adineta ricciae]|uniref:Uncharacterized protein n=1 Tax=Adineta ricciae TaxID=249248 RepID=A0A815IXE0_ADIRI|nr:unnamed protein product [Adineta ricciae]